MSIATDLTRLQTAKADLKTAIEGKGVTVPSATKIDGYADLVDSIQSGGGGDNTKWLNLVARTGTSFSDNDIVTIGQNAFSFWASLQDMSLPNLTTIASSAFQGCTSIKNFFFPKVTSISGGNAFNNAGATDSVIVLPLITGLFINNINAFRGVAIDLGASLSNIATLAFQSSANLNLLILRKSDAVVSLNHINNFYSTAFADGKAGGTLYVPSALISSYQSATNWSTILGYANNSIAAIEGSQYENYYADGTPIT